MQNFRGGVSPPVCFLGILLNDVISKRCLEMVEADLKKGLLQEDEYGDCIKIQPFGVVRGKGKTSHRFYKRRRP